ARKTTELGNLGDDLEAATTRTKRSMSAAAATAAAAAAARHRGRDEPTVALQPEHRELPRDVGAGAGGAGHLRGGAGHVLLEVLVAGPAPVLVDRHRRLASYWPPRCT